MEPLAKKLIEFAPKDVLRVVSGGLVLGIVLMVFLKVMDNKFGLTQWELDALGLALTPVLALLLVLDQMPFQRKAIKWLAASMVIFTVGFMSNQVIAEVREIWTAPPPIPAFEDI